MAYTTIKKPSLYFNTKLYSGTGSSNSITGVGHQPDLTWIKDRDTTNNQCFYDAVRTATKVILPNANNAETTYAQGLTAFGTDGFTVGTDSQNNTNGNDLVSWNWKAGTTSGLSGGTITPSSYSINTTSKFGIYKYTGNGTNGATIAHGLGAVPTFMIFKKTSGTDDWKVYHKSIGAAKSIRLDSTDSESSDSTLLNSTAPTSTLITLGTSSAINTNSETYICYAFCDVQGYCKTGKYTANNSTDGNFIPTGHKPKLFMLKAYTGGSSNSRNWLLYDDNRNGINSSTSGYENRSLRPNKTDTEA